MVEGHVAFNHDGVGTEWDGDPLGMKPVFGVEIHNVGGGNEGGHISTGFAGEIGVNLPEVVLAAGTGDGFVDIAGAAVVGGNGEMPVAENFVEVVKIVCRGIGRFVGVAALVDDGVDFKAIVFAGGVHELP